MIRLVTLDLYDTLAGAVPIRPERLVTACLEAGLTGDLELFRRGYVLADDYYTVENGANAIHLRDRDEVENFYREFTRIILAHAGLPDDADTCDRVRARIMAQPNKRELYPDVVPALDALRARGLTLGIVSNTPVDARPLCEQLDLVTRVDFIVSSCLVGAEKPDRRIFEAALEQAGVAAPDAIHVGDQPLSDVVGALGVGMRALLIDREDLRADVTTCPRIASLLEILDYLD